MSQIDTSTAIAGIAAVLGAVSLLLHFIAPLTKNTIDDRLRDDIDEILAFTRGSTLPPRAIGSSVGPMPPAPSAPPRIPGSGRVGLTVAVLLATIGLFCWACATVQTAATSGAEAFIDCESPPIKSALGDLLPIGKAAVKRLIGGTGQVDTAALQADMAAIKSDLGRCLEAAAIAAASSEAPRVGVAGPTVDGTQVLAAFATVRTSLDWAPVRLASGQVL